MKTQKSCFYISKLQKASLTSFGHQSSGSEWQHITQEQYFPPFPSPQWHNSYLNMEVQRLSVTPLPPSVTAIPHTHKKQVQLNTDAKGTKQGKDFFLKTFLISVL